MQKGPWIAFGWGVFSAISLPIGAILGMWLKPRNVIVAAFMAFGGGALLAALTLDLVQKGIEKQFADPHVPHAILSLSAGLVLGGLLFVALDKIINSQGGFLRKTSTAFKHVVSLRRARLKRMVEALSAVHAFRHIPAGDIRQIARCVRPVSFKSGETIFRQGEKGDRMYFVIKGDVEVTSGEKNHPEAKEIARIKADDILGEIALLTGKERSATATAKSDVRMLQLTQADLQQITAQNPQVQKALSNLAHERLMDMKVRSSIPSADPKKWLVGALEAIDNANIAPTEDDVKQAAKEEGSGAALGIWLGILLDGIPESLVIGASMIGASISPSLLAGLFLSNMPEAMSSSVLMRKQNYSVRKVLWMWMSLVIIVGVGAFFGNMFFELLPDQIHIFMAGLASGSMLVMIAQTMMPEAFHQGGNVTGLSTLAGFLVIVLMKLWSPGGH